MLVCPSKKQGGEKTTTINKVAVFIAQLYTKLPIIATLIFVSGDMDPLYYILPITSFSPGVCIFVLRSILFLIAGTEVCRLVVITLFCTLFAINVVKREMHMWMHIAGRSYLGGILFYRHFAILYNCRRMWATGMLTLVTTVGFTLQVNFLEDLCAELINLQIHNRYPHKYCIRESLVK